MKRKSRIYFFNMLTLFVLPYLLSLFMNDIDTVVLSRKFEPESLLPFILCTQISAEYEVETVKAQAVIARSNLYRKIEEKDDLSFLYEEQKRCADKQELIIEAFSDIYEKAVNETAGQILTVNGELKLIPFHEISAGMTRDGEIAFHDPEYAYLQSVNSSADKNSPDYLNSTYIALQQMPDMLKIGERDQSGYVVSLAADENILEAEAFAKAMGIASSNFSIQEIGDKVRFLSRGKGHGLGFSQYGANELAKEGKTWEELLMQYFPEMEITEYVL